MINTKILILGVGLAIQLTASALGYNLEEYYPLVQGNMWKYSTADDEGSGEEKSEIAGREMIDGKETIKKFFPDYGDNKCLAIDSEGVKIYKHFKKAEVESGDEDIIYNPPRLIFPNLEPGQVKEYSTVWSKRSLSGKKKEEGSEVGQIKLEFVENIEVPAGKFTDCLKFSVIYNVKSFNGESENRECDVWFAPGVGMVKEFCIYTDREKEGGPEETSFKIYKLISAVINGERIGSQE